MRKEATLTSKGQVTIPREIRRLLGVGTGDKLIFESEGERVVVRSDPVRGRFARYRGIGNPGIESGRRGINKWLRDLRDGE